MSILPIIKRCTTKNAMALYTRRNIFKHSTVFNLIGRGVYVENGSTVQVGPTEHIVDDLGSFMHTSSCPTCRIYGREVVAMVDMFPGDELTYNPKQTKY